MDAWDLYRLCRNQELIIFEKPTGKKDGSKMLTRIIWTTGISTLPEGRGLLSEDFLLMRYFSGFLQGDREAAAKELAKKGK